MELGRDRVLHAGFHKTGSTFLQKKVFPNLSHVRYLGGGVDLAKMKPLERNQIALFSSEASCGYPYPAAEKFSMRKLASCVEILGVNKVFIVNREFYSWCLSLYFQTLNEGHVWGVEEYIQRNKANLLSWKEASASIRLWCEESGLGFHCEQYGDLCSDPEAAVKRICDFVGAEPVSVDSSRENPSRYGNVTLTIYRVLNFLCRPRIIFRAAKLVRLTPRRLIQGGFGNMLEKCSYKTLTVDDVKKVIS